MQRWPLWCLGWGHSWTGWMPPRRNRLAQCWLFDYDLKDLELNFGVKASVSRIDDNSIFFENVIYGEKSRNKLDIHIPDIESPNGLLIFFHGGAFVGGDKSDIFEEYLSSTFLKIIKPLEIIFLVEEI